MGVAVYTRRDFDASGSTAHYLFRSGQFSEHMVAPGPHSNRDRYDSQPFLPGSSA